jgi:hypothetical protein
MSYEQLTKELQNNCTITPRTIDAIEHYAALFSKDICDQYRKLNDIVTRHELLIRKRWTKKSPAQRREILLAAWSDMPREYCPEDVFNPMPYST